MYQMLNDYYRNMLSKLGTCCSIYSYQVIYKVITFLILIQYALITNLDLSITS